MLVFHCLFSRLSLIVNKITKLLKLTEFIKYFVKGKAYVNYT